LGGASGRVGRGFFQKGAMALEAPEKAFSGGAMRKYRDAEVIVVESFLLL